MLNPEIRALGIARIGKATVIVASMHKVTRVVQAVMYEITKEPIRLLYYW